MKTIATLTRMGTSMGKLTRSGMSALCIATVALIALIAPAGSALAQAGNFPDKPLRFVGGLSPGGPADLAARIVAQSLSQRLGQPVIVENKLGGGGVTALLDVSRAPKDGYTLGAPTTGPLTVVPKLQKNPAYDTLSIVTPVAQLAAYPYVLVVRKDLPVNSVAELLDYARKNPGKLSYGSGGNGTSNHIGMEWLKKIAGIHLVHIPYKGDNDIVRDVVGGRIDLAMNTPSVILGQIRAGTVKALAVASPKRLSVLPQLPTMVESGVKDFVLEAYTILVGPAGMPADVVTKLNREINEVLKTSDVAARMEQAHMYGVIRSPDELAKYIADQQVLWGAVIKDAGVPLQ